MNPLGCSAAASFTTYSAALKSMGEPNVLGEICTLLKASSGALATSPSSGPKDFSYHVRRIDCLLERLPATSSEVIFELNDLRGRFSGLPCDIVGPEVWETQHPRVWRSTHLKSDITDALYNIARAGHKTGPTDENWLRLILTHWSGWSGTDRNHLCDPWVLYLKALYRHIPHLEPVLDSLVWPEELKRFPTGCTPTEPSFFLLATPESFYVFDLDGLGLYNAGNTLEEVYMGLRDCKHNGMGDGDWSPEGWSELELDERDFFPIYGCLRNNDGGFNLQRTLKMFPANLISSTDLAQ